MAEGTVESSLPAHTTPSRALGAVLAVATVLALAVVLAPVVLIRPFSPQTPRTVAAAYHLRTVSPWLAPALAAGALLAAVALLARRPASSLRVLAVLATLLAGGAAWLSHQNHFEWMFAPLPSAQYARAREATFVDPSDMVVAIELNGDAVAYPVRQMAYHHVLNEEAGGVPLVSTY